MLKAKNIALRLIAIAVCVFTGWVMYDAIASGLIWMPRGRSASWATSPDEFVSQFAQAAVTFMFFGVFLVLTQFDERLADAVREWKRRRK